MKSSFCIVKLCVEDYYMGCPIRYLRIFGRVIAVWSVVK